jgi:hypothetical protein
MIFLATFLNLVFVIIVDSVIDSLLWGVDIHKQMDYPLHLHASFTTIESES